MIEPVVYFICYDSDRTNPPRPKGYLLIAPYTDCPAPSGYERREARYLHEAYDLERRLVRQERDGWEQEAELESQRFSDRQAVIRDRLYQRMISSSTDVYEQEFIRAWLQLKDEQKRERYAQRLGERQMYLHALHFDTPKGRRVDEETVQLDRININT
jgi:hypothetical protein